MTPEHACVNGRLCVKLSIGQFSERVAGRPLQARNERNREPMVSPPNAFGDATQHMRDSASMGETVRRYSFDVTPCRAGTQKIPAATYSPAPLPGQYHRRWRA